MFLDGNECLGLCDYDAKTIFVLSGLTNEETLLVYVHEIIHAAISELHLSIDYVTDEVLADGLSAIIISALKVGIK